MIAFDDVTTATFVKTYNSALGVFSALLREVRELSKKKPDATLSASKVKLINNVLCDLLTFLASEPEGKYLHKIEDDTLPQVSDALMMMAQFDAALDAYRGRYYIYNTSGRYSRGKHIWITEEQLEAWKQEEVDDEVDDSVID